MGRVVGSVNQETGEITFSRLADPSVEKQRIRSGLQGATFASADEIEAAIRSLPSLLTGDFGSTYEQTVGDIRKQLEEYQTAYPMESMAYEIGGAVVPTLAATMLTGGAGTAPATASTAARVAANPAMRTFLQSYAPSLLKGAGIGATEAGLYEFGSGEGGVSERLKGVPEAAAIGGALGPVFQLGGRALGMGIGAITNKARRLFGAQSADVVEAELQRIMSESGIPLDEILDAVARGETLAEISETTRRTIGAYLSDLSHPALTSMDTRADKAREVALRNTQKVLTGDVDANVLKIFRKGVDEADQLASREYDKVFDEFGSLPDSVNDAMTDILVRNIDEAPQILKGLRLQGVKDPFFKVSKSGEVEILRTPTLREAERVRRSLSDLALNSKGQMKADYKALELKLRNVIDTASPELADVRAVWANTRRGAELFEQGRKVLTKSADEIEIDFEKVTQEGADAIAAYRQGVMDAIRNKRKEKSLPALLTTMSNKEARIFAQIFPEDEYQKAYDLWDRATRAAKVAGEKAKTESTPRAAIRQRIGSGAVIADIVETAGFNNPIAAARLMGKGFKVLGQDISQDQQRKIAHLLLSEDKDLVTRALNSNKGWDQVQKRILQIQKSLEAGARRAPAPIAEELGGEGLSGLLF
jgi:hypothetical protein